MDGGKGLAAADLQPGGQSRPSLMGRTHFHAAKETLPGSTPSGKDLPSRQRPGGAGPGGLPSGSGSLRAFSRHFSLLLLKFERLVYHLGLIAGRADGRGTHEDGSRFHGKGSGLDVASHLGQGTDFDPVGDCDVAFHPALDNDRTALDLSLDVGRFPDGQRTLRNNPALDLTVHDEIALEADFSLDLDVAAENIALACGNRDELIGFCAQGGSAFDLRSGRGAGGSVSRVFADDLLKHD